MPAYAPTTNVADLIALRWRTHTTFNDGEMTKSIQVAVGRKLWRVRTRPSDNPAPSGMGRPFGEWTTVRTTGIAQEASDLYNSL